MTFWRGNVNHNHPILDNDCALWPRVVLVKELIVSIGQPLHVTETLLHCARPLTTLFSRSPIFDSQTHLPRLVSMSLLSVHVVYVHILHTEKRRLKPWVLQLLYGWRSGRRRRDNAQFTVFYDEVIYGDVLTIRSFETKRCVKLFAKFSLCVVRIVQNVRRVNGNYAGVIF
jgi:hypothetical protein